MQFDKEFLKNCHLSTQSPPQDDQFQVIVHVALIGYYIFDIFLTMYFGDLLIHKSDDLRVSLYQSNWVQQSLTFRRIAMILFERLQVPTVIRVGKLFPLSLQTFSSVNLMKTKSCHFLEVN